MTVPRRPDGWGSGIPGIPSIWDTGAPAPASEWLPPLPARRSGGEQQGARRWAGGAVGLLLVLALGGGLFAGSADQVSFDAAPDGFLEPGVPPPFGPPPFGPPPFPDGLPAPEPVAEGRLGSTLLAERADGDGEPFGLPLGTPVLVRDLATGAALQVRPLSAVREGDLVLVDVELSVPGANGAEARVPSLLLRLPDGREVPPWQVRGRSGGTGVPPWLASGATWRASLGFDGGAQEAVLVLTDGAAVAGWAVPAAG